MILSDEQIKRYSSALDGAIDFEKWDLKLKFLKVINIDVSKQLEKLDSKLFKKALSLLNDIDMNDDLAEFLTKVFADIDSEEQTDLVSTILDYVFEKTSVLGETTETTIKVTVVALVSNIQNLLTELNNKIDELVEE